MNVQPINEYIPKIVWYNLISNANGKNDESWIKYIIYSLKISPFEFLLYSSLYEFQYCVLWDPDTLSFLWGDLMGEPTARIR